MPPFKALKASICRLSSSSGTLFLASATSTRRNRGTTFEHRHPITDGATGVKGRKVKKRPSTKEGGSGCCLVRSGRRLAPVGQVGWLQQHLVVAFGDFVRRGRERVAKTRGCRRRPVLGAITLLRPNRYLRHPSSCCPYPATPPSLLPCVLLFVFPCLLSPFLFLSSFPDRLLLLAFLLPSFPSFPSSTPHRDPQNEGAFESRSCYTPPHPPHSTHNSTLLRIATYFHFPFLPCSFCTFTFTFTLLHSSSQ